jgi:hypothetical protein
VVERFVSRLFTPGCYAVDALRQDWDEVTDASDVIWVFPPHRQVSLVLSLIESHQKQALLCMPVKSGSNELIQLHQMQGAIVSEPYMIPRLASSCIPSARKPAESLNPALLQLGVVYISWKNVL